MQTNTKRPVDDDVKMEPEKDEAKEVEFVNDGSYWDCDFCQTLNTIDDSKCVKCYRTNELVELLKNKWHQEY